MNHDKPPPLYCGNARQIDREGKEPFFSVDLDLTELKRRGEFYEFEVNHRDGPRRHIRIIVAPLKPENADQHRTHSVKVDTWKPDPSKRRDNGGSGTSVGQGRIGTPAGNSGVSDAGGGDEVPF